MDRKDAIAYRPALLLSIINDKKRKTRDRQEENQRQCEVNKSERKEREERQPIDERQA